MGADVTGAYLNAPCHEKVYTICGLEFSAENIGKIAIITKALYGLKTSAFAWREQLSRTLREDLHYTPCLADNDVWLRKSTKPDGTRYYEMTFIYTDYLLVISHKPKETLTQLNQHYHIKSDSIGIPKTYLGSQVKEFHINHDPNRACQSLSSEKYIQDAINNLKGLLAECGESMKTRMVGVLPSGYRPELDIWRISVSTNSK